LNTYEQLIDMFMNRNNGSPVKAIVLFKKKIPVWCWSFASCL